MKNIKFLILTDSNGNPRGFPKSELFYPEDTYFSQLQKYYKDSFFWQISIGDVTTAQLINQPISYFSHWKPDIIVVQSGINDCVPEIFSVKKFQRVLKKFKMIFADSKIFWLEICSGKKFEEIVPGVTNLKDSHNLVIKEIYGESFIKLECCLVENGGFNAFDYVHVSKQGHQIIKEILIEEIDLYLSTLSGEVIK